MTVKDPEHEILVISHPLQPSDPIKLAKLDHYKTHPSPSTIVPFHLALTRALFDRDATLSRSTKAIEVIPFT